MDHKSKNTHHGSTSVVEFDGTLLKLGLLVKGIPAEIGGSVAVVSGEFTVSIGLANDELEEEDEDENLRQATLGEGGDGSKTRGDIGELLAVKGQVSWEAVSGKGVKVTSNGKHGDTSVLDLNLAKTLESGLASVVKHTKRIKESKSKETVRDRYGLTVNHPTLKIPQLGVHERHNSFGTYGGWAPSSSWKALRAVLLVACLAGAKAAAEARREARMAVFMVIVIDCWWVSTNI